MHCTRRLLPERSLRLGSGLFRRSSLPRRRNIYRAGVVARACDGGLLARVLPFPRNSDATSGWRWRYERHNLRRPHCRRRPYDECHHLEDVSAATWKGRQQVARRRYPQGHHSTKFPLLCKLLLCQIIVLALVKTTGQTKMLGFGDWVLSRFRVIG